MKTEDLVVEIYDIECFRAMFLYCGHNLKTGERFQYELSRRKNELDSLVKHLVDRKFDFGVGYNCVTYDNQVLQYIIDNHRKWFDKTFDEVLLLIYNFSMECISLTNYELPAPYKEQYMTIPQIDVFRVHHYDNKNRRVGLKTLEFAMDMPDIEEMPLDFRKEYLTDEEMEETVKYCWNDVDSTKRFWDITTGNTDNELYKNKDKIQDRLDIIEEMKFDKRTLNWSDVKIGDEINKKGYMSEMNCTINEIYNRKRDRKPTPKFTYGDCIPKYVKFKSKEFNDLYKSVKKLQVSLSNKDKQEFVVKYGETTYSIMRGGIHSQDPVRIVEAGNGYIIKDADISSQYPNAINKRNLYPSHLGPSWNVNYEKTIYKRLEYKDLGKKSSKHKGISEMYKLALNGGGYGMTNQTDNWQYDPKVMFTCTIGNQFEILMLIEMLEEVGIKVISANTDGIVSLIPQEKDKEYYRICEEWEVLVGNDKMGKLEYTDYKKLVQTSVNDYLAIGIDGKVKTKGDFNVDVELHKNKSNRIVPIALTKWYAEGIPVEETVKNHRDIWAFVIGKKASKDYYYQGINKKTGQVHDYNKLLRYYCCDPKSDIGEKLYKIKHENSDKRGPKRSQCESSSAKQVMFNKSFVLEKFEDYKIDYTYYLNEVYKLLDQLEREKARDRKNDDKKQLNLF